MTRILLLLLAVILLPANTWASAYGKVRSGNKYFKKSEYEKSLEKYRDAEISAPNNPAVYFNIGNALHKTGDYEGAANEYTKALGSKDKLLKSKAYYNLGNNAYAQENMEDALNNYKKCLALNPNDMDAKYNIEYLLNVKNNPKNKNDKNDKKGKDKDKDKDKKQDSSSSKDKNKDNENKDKAEKEKQKGGMSKEDAQRILQYYNDKEKNSADKRKMRSPELPKVEEDW